MKYNRFIVIIIYVKIIQGLVPPDCDRCSDFFISGPRGISDDKLTASSIYPNDRFLYDPKYSRLHFYKSVKPTAGAWSAGNNNDQQYIQAEFSNTKFVRAIATQGRSHSKQWVTSYSVSYSIDGRTWMKVKDVNKNIKIYPANNDNTSIVTNYLPTCVEAKYIRLHPKTWYTHISMRFDAIGCSKLDNRIQRNKMNWKRHPIILTPEVKHNLTQVFKTSSQTIHVCAVKCQQNPLCLSFSLHQKSSTCTGFQEETYQNDASFSAVGDEMYFISLTLLKNYGYEIIDSLNLRYKFITLTTTAAAASTLCKEEKSRLLSILGLDQMNIVKKSICDNLILSQQIYFYVDGTNQNGQWKFVTGTVIPAPLWSPSHPLPDNGDCVTLTQNGLETHNCTDNLYFICGV